MKKLLSVLLVVSMVLAPINSRVSFADETASNETDYEQGYELNETSDGQVSDLSKINEPSLCKRLWQGVKSGFTIFPNAFFFMYDAVAADPQFTIVTTLWAATIFAVVRFANQFKFDDQKSGLFAAAKAAASQLLRTSNDFKEMTAKDKIVQFVTNAAGNAVGAVDIGAAVDAAADTAVGAVDINAAVVAAVDTAVRAADINAAVGAAAGAAVDTVVRAVNINAAVGAAATKAVTDANVAEIVKTVAEEFVKAGGGK